MPSGLEELIQQVDAVQYLEYSAVGLMKAELLTVDALGRWAFSDAREVRAQACFVRAICSHSLRLAVARHSLFALPCLFQGAD